MKRIKVAGGFYLQEKVATPLTASGITGTFKPTTPVAADSIRSYFLTTAVTANSTVVTGARQGDIVRTTNATGRASIFRVDGSAVAQYLTNA